jgi:hypothetical protein
MGRGCAGCRSARSRNGSRGRGAARQEPQPQSRAGEEEKGEVAALAFPGEVQYLIFKQHCLPLDEALNPGRWRCASMAPSWPVTGRHLPRCPCMSFMGTREGLNSHGILQVEGKGAGA